MSSRMKALPIVLLSVLLSTSMVFASVTVTEDQSVADRFVRYTVTGITTPVPQSPDVPGFIGASYVSVDDIDKDGHKEIVCTSGVGEDGNVQTFDGAVALFKMNGSLGNWTKSVLNASFAFPNETMIRDMDNDTDLDIMVMDNFLAGWYSCGAAGIYYLENQGGDITQPQNWVKKTIHQGVVDYGNCPCYPLGSMICTDGIESYHRARFLDLDGDGLEDFITSKVHMWYWQNTDRQYVWTEWFKKETDLQTYPSGFSGPYEIGDGAGFLFEVADVDNDTHHYMDVIGPQFFIFESGFVRYPPGNIHGDSAIWFKNPGPTADANSNGTKDVFELWPRYTIDNEHTSPNPVGKGMEIIPADIDNDGDLELVMANHNHQQYSTYSGNPLRYWPSGVYYFEIPADPTSVSQWTPITIETGDPNLDPENHTAVLNDVYGVDRDFNAPTSQGSPGMIRAQDITGDGLPDLLVPGDGKGKLYFYESDGLLSYRRAALYADVACMPGEARYEDIDNDGRTDIIAVIFDTSVNKADPYDSGSVFILHQDPDRDADGTCTSGMTDPTCSGSDNCPSTPNGPAAGTCLSENSGMFGKPCTTPGPNPAECGVGGICSMAQEDADSNGTGDACESYCFADCNNDRKVILSDLVILKSEFGKTTCNPADPTKCCGADANGDRKVILSDLVILKTEFGRTSCPLRINRCVF